MFSLAEVILIALAAALIAGYLSYHLAQFVIFTRLISSLSEGELDRLDKLREQLENALDDSEADRIIEAARSQPSRTLTQEVVAGQTFLFEDSKFVAQGSSDAAAAQAFFESKHSSSTATVECRDGTSYRIIDGKIEP